MKRFVAALSILAVVAAPALAAAPPECRMVPLLLWGDGKHDDTAALNAWWQAKPVIWAETGNPVGPRIVGHTFRLSAAIYVPSGTGRTMVGFRLVWPSHHERVTGGTIASGSDPDRPPVSAGLRKIGGDPGEGVPFAGADATPTRRRAPRDCPIS